MNATQKKIALSYTPLAVARLFGFTTSEVRPKTLPGFVTFFDPGWSISRTPFPNQSLLPTNKMWSDVELEEQPQYRQLRMTAVPDSFNKTFPEQQTLLPTDEEVPCARVVIVGMVIHFLATGERLFADRVVRCSDISSCGRRLCVGHFDRDGLHFYNSWDNVRDTIISLASSRKF